MKIIREHITLSTYERIPEPPKSEWRLRYEEEQRLREQGRYTQGRLNRAWDELRNCLGHCTTPLPQGDHLLFSWDRRAGRLMGIVGACLVCGRVPLSCDIDEYNGQMHQFGAGQGYTVCHLCWLDNFPRAMDVGYWEGHWR